MAIWPFRKRDRSLGANGEEVACKFLKHHGIKILARNYRCPHGEIDIIAFDKDAASHFGSNCIIFVDVKTRRSDAYATPASAVDEDKQRRIKKTAGYYLTHRQATEMPVRYDIISIVMGDGPPRVQHITGAFS